MSVSLLNNVKSVGKKVVLSDEELLKVSISENPELFSEIVKKYQAPFLRKARSILKTESDAEDAVQETFVKIYIHGLNFKKRENATFQSWAYRVLINTCLTLYRKKMRDFENTAGELDESLLEVSNLDPLETALEKDTFLSVLSRMPVQLASVLNQLVVFGKSLKEVARIEHVTVGAIRTRLHRARKVFSRVYATVK